MQHHDGLLVNRVDDRLDEEIDGIVVDFAMRLMKVTLAALDRTPRDEKRLLDSVQKVNDPQTCVESVVFTVRVGVSGVLCHLYSSYNTAGHDG